MDYDVPTLHSLDNEYIAEEYLVTVTSNINHSQFRFISGVYGPLEANFPTKLPLWLAITLTKKGKCRIHPPAWMTVSDSHAVVVRQTYIYSIVQIVEYTHFYLISSFL